MTTEQIEEIRGRHINERAEYLCPTCNRDIASLLDHTADLQNRLDDLDAYCKEMKGVIPSRYAALTPKVIEAALWAINKKAEEHCECYPPCSRYESLMTARAALDRAQLDIAALLALDEERQRHEQEKRYAALTPEVIEAAIEALVLLEYGIPSKPGRHYAYARACAALKSLKEASSDQ